MERYTKKFSGILAGMVKSDTGDWCKYEEASASIDHNCDTLFEVIKERNEEIELVRTSLDLSRNQVIRVNEMREDDLKEHQTDSMHNFSELQNAMDDLGEIKLRNTKLFSLLVISTLFNFVAIVAVAFFIVDIMVVA